VTIYSRRLRVCACIVRLLVLVTVMECILVANGQCD
jgi:hypothetical protein